MTVEQEPQEWPLHLGEDGKIHCPACNSDDVEDTGHQLFSPEDAGISVAPNAHECNACGNIFCPVDATEHPLRSLDNTQVM